MSTVSLEQWRVHIEAARSQGMALAQYARAHGLSHYALYAASKKLRRRSRADSVSGDATASTTPFIAVQVASSPLVLRAELPNGVILHWQGTDASDTTSWLHALAALPCSR
ncbi:IS66 family insertion sequence element accessory protein TnpA [Noviherbaspirillum malthae]|uniref:IS66 family insertion sequence element accessory protein TnpA n=1 Tax=Noviherbaspirillum malthae TaxID=1260987 RepID=UPI00189010F1|nr:hypothetical protein [Noviherbaspirillum malthae]